MCKREIYIHITDYSFTPLVFFQVAIETMMYKVRLSRPYELKKIWLAVHLVNYAKL